LAGNDAPLDASRGREPRIYYYYLRIFGRPTVADSGHSELLHLLPLVPEGDVGIAKDYFSELEWLADCIARR